MRSVYLRKNFPPCFAGETAGYPDSIADKLVASSDAYEVDAAGEPVIPPEDAAAAKAKKSKRSTAKNDSPAADGQTAGAAGDKDQLKFNPFVVDGLDEKLVAVLAKAKITTPDELLAYIVAGKPLTDIDGIGEVYAGQLLELYGS